MQLPNAIKKAVNAHLSFLIQEPVVWYTEPVQVKNVGLAYGWGLARTIEEADKIAKKECNDRTYGMSVPNFITSCNETNSGTLTQIYNASREIDFMMGIQQDY